MKKSLIIVLALIAVSALVMQCKNINKIAWIKKKLVYSFSAFYLLDVL